MECVSCERGSTQTTFPGGPVRWPPTHEKVGASRHRKRVSNSALHYSKTIDSSLFFYLFFYLCVTAVMIKERAKSVASDLFPRFSFVFFLVQEKLQQHFFSCWMLRGCSTKVDGRFHGSISCSNCFPMMMSLRQSQGSRRWILFPFPCPIYARKTPPSNSDPLTIDYFGLRF